MDTSKLTRIIGKNDDLSTGNDSYVTANKSESHHTIKNCFQEMKDLRLKYVRNIIISYVNINSIRNKFSHFSIMMKGLVDILIIAETKLYSTFHNGQFLIEGFKKPYRLDVSSDRDGLFVCLKDRIISKQLNK